MPGPLRMSGVTNTITMKTPFRLIPSVMIATMLALRANAGETYSPPQPPEIFGSGWYGAIELGANLHQDRGDTRVFTNLIGDSLIIEPKNDTGFFGGIKIGYVFGQGPVRFALEEDMFYNGWETGADSTLTVGGVTTTSSSSFTINTGAFMTNALVKFGNGKFQPYIGAGLGVYYGESAGGTFGPFTVGGGSSHADFAWQVIAGADCYLNQRNSIFVEYKFLEYTSSQADFGDSRVLGQHLLGGGWRFHF